MSTRGVSGLDPASGLGKKGTQEPTGSVLWGPLSGTPEGALAAEGAFAPSDALPLVKGMFGAGPGDGELWRVAMVGSFWIDEYCKHTNYQAGSRLSGAMLRMYLLKKLNPDTIRQAGEEIGASDTFKALGKSVQDALTSFVKSDLKITKAWPGDEQLRKYAEDFLVLMQKEYGIAFRGPLNAVIGGITGIKVPKIDILQRVKGAKSGVEYRLHVTLSDSYDFENDRSGNPKYDGFRRLLAGLLLTKQRKDFARIYNASLVAGHPLSRNLVFASYMYAVEKAGIAGPGLKWSVTIPMPGKVYDSP